jgi:HSP20 family protein
MALIPFRPFDMDRFFEEAWSERNFGGKEKVPRVDVYEKEGNVVAKAELPGLKKEDIKIEVEDNYLKIETETKQEKEEANKDYYRKEIRSGYCQRIVSLPAEVIVEQARAKYEDGILKVVMPKAQPKEEKKRGTEINIE